MARTHRARARLLLVLTVVLLAPLVPAQGVSVGSMLSGGQTIHEVSEQAVLDAAVASFRRAAAERLGLSQGQDTAPDSQAGSLPADRAAELAEEAGARFERAVVRALATLSGDGLLLADEVSTTLSELRDEHLQTLEADHAALASGHARPPRRADATSDLDHHRAVLLYTLTERNDWQHWLTLLGAVAAGFGLAVIVLKVSSWNETQSADPGWRQSAAATVGELHGPLYLLFATGGLVLGLTSVWLPDSLRSPAWTCVVALMLAALFWAAWRLTASATRRVGRWATPDGRAPGEQVLEIVRKVLRLGLIALFAFVGVELLFDADLTTLIAGLGIVGLAATLAAQDTLKDLFAAITIHANEPFKLGDLVRFGGYFGTIEVVGFRMTRLRTLDGHLVTVPNAKLVSELVENVDARPHVRRRFHLDLPYETSVPQVARAVELVREVIDAAGDLDDERGVQVHFDELGPHSLRLLVQYYYGEGDYWASKAKATEIDLELLRRFEQEGIEFALPTQRVHLREDPPARDDDRPVPDERESDGEDQRADAPAGHTDGAPGGEDST